MGAALVPSLTVDPVLVCRRHAFAWGKGWQERLRKDVACLAALLIDGDHGGRDALLCEHGVDHADDGKLVFLAEMFERLKAPKQTGVGKRGIGAGAGEQIIDLGFQRVGQLDQHLYRGAVEAALILVQLLEPDAEPLAEFLLGPVPDLAQCFDAGAQGLLVGDVCHVIPYLRS